MDVHSLERIFEISPVRIDWFSDETWGRRRRAKIMNAFMGRFGVPSALRVWEVSELSSGRGQKEWRGRGEETHRRDHCRPFDQSHHQNQKWSRGRWDQCCWCCCWHCRMVESSDSCLLRGRGARKENWLFRKTRRVRNMCLGELVRLNGLVQTET